MYSSKTKGTIRKAFEYVLTVIYSDQMRGKTDQEYTPSYFHNIYKESNKVYDNDQISESSFKKVVPIIGYYGLLIKIGNKYLLNNKLQFKNLMSTKVLKIKSNLLLLLLVVLLMNMIIQRKCITQEKFQKDLNHQIQKEV